MRWECECRGRRCGWELVAVRSAERTFQGRARLVVVALRTDKPQLAGVSSNVRGVERDPGQQSSANAVRRGGAVKGLSQDCVWSWYILGTLPCTPSPCTS